jgi:phosphonate metabolism protein PhnN/1,5-bisphosphokinase (PRPP-forming)
MTPGRLVLVVGPSGAGKDTVLDYARTRLAHDNRYVFPLRVITRPPGPGEAHEPVSPADFAARRYALSWEAHGLFYGIPACIEADLAAGKTVIANVSRGVTAEAVRKYRCLVVEITAPREILAARLAGRQREDSAQIAARLSRATPRHNADVTIMNDSTPAAAGEAFLAAITGG